MRMARALQAEYWSVSSKSGDNIDRLFLRVAALTFDISVASECQDSYQQKEIGNGLVSKSHKNLFYSL